MDKPILIVNKRFNGVVCPPISRNDTVANALISLIKYEIGYGGHVTDIHPTRVVIRTQVLGCTDTTTYSGSEEDMKPLLETACYEVMSRKHVDMDAIFEKMKAWLPDMRAGFVVWSSGLFIGAEKVRLLLILASGLDPKDERVKKLKSDDLEAVMKLVADGAQPEDALAAAL